MRISYNKLWKMLIDKNMKITEWTDSSGKQHTKTPMGDFS